MSKPAPPGSAMGGSDGSVPALKGYLLKRGHFVKSWRKRWFILRGNTLTYSVSEEEGNDKGSFQLNKSTTVIESSLQPHCFCLLDGKRELYMAAQDEAEMTEWMEALQETVTAQNFTYSSAKSIGSVKLSRLFQTSRGANTLTVKLTRARGLSAKNKNNTSNPYAIIAVGVEKSKSSTIMGQLNPTWNEVFTFPFDRTLRYARLEIWDEDNGAKDRFLGVVMIPLFMLSSGTVHGNWYGLGKRSSRSRVHGELFVEVSCNVDVETIADNMLRDVCRLPELSMLPYLQSPGLLNRNNKFSAPNFYFPGEVLEDMSMHVILKVDLGGESYYSSGVLMLTNYRLIFVGASRLNASRKVQSVSESQDNGDICTYMPVGSIVNLSIGEEIDYLNPALSIETIRIKTSDSRAMTFLFRDTAFIDSESMASGPSVSVDRGAGYMQKGFAASSTMRSFSAAPAVPTKIKLEDCRSDSDEARVHVGRQRRASLNPTLGKGMMEQMQALFRSLGGDSSVPEKNWANQYNAQRSVHAKESFSKSVKDMGSLGDDLEDDIHYLEATESVEGPPSQRIFARINFRVIFFFLMLFCRHIFLIYFFQVLNRHLEYRQSCTLLRAMMNCSTADSESSVDPLNGSIVEARLTDSPNIRPSESDINKEKRVGGRNFAPIQLGENDGWEVYDPIVEFNRMSIPDAYWKLSIANSHEYSVCDTYPAVLAVPYAAEDSLVEGSAQFRSRGRLPALSWRHPRNKTSLTRCSQPLVGIGQKRSPEDEAMLHLINSARGLEAMSSSVSTCVHGVTDRKGSYETKKPLMIMDARPKINAQANQAAGKGFELPKAYSNSHINFLEIANIHAVRTSLESLEELCCNDAGSEGSWLKNVETTGWLLHIRKILAGATRIVHCLDQEELSVLVHCSDGWDRTAQLTSLAMLMLDGHYRTLSGFITLVDKEWFSFGHKFQDRLGFSAEGWNSDDRSPVFQQFIECVFQFMYQMPDIFEFNEGLLLFILHGLQSGMFGNVYSNCERERGPHQHSMPSIWNIVLSNRDAFLNNRFNATDRICVPVVSAKRIIVWNNWFLSWHDTIYSHIWNGRMEDLVAADESFMDSIMPPMRWVDNNTTKNCCDPLCNRPFTVYRRRHHCRACGLIFCERCSSHRRIVASVSSSVLSRTCKSCAHQIDMANRFKSRNIHARPRAVGNTTSQQRVFSERLLIIDDDSEDEGGLFRKTGLGSGERVKVGSAARNFELGGNSGSAKHRSRSFSEVPT